jgi:hypothetical protein
MKTPDQVLALIKKRINKAVKDFGSYSFIDKGPHEVLDYNTLLNELKSLDPEDAIKVIGEVCNYRSDGTGEVISDYFLNDLGVTFDTPPIAKVQVSNISALWSHLPQKDQDEINKRFQDGR